jgi:hypothetical protein
VQWCAILFGCEPETLTFAAPLGRGCVVR